MENDFNKVADNKCKKRKLLIEPIDNPEEHLEPKQKRLRPSRTPVQVATKVQEEEQKNDKSQNDKGKGEYFWPRELHEEFMRHFTVWGKTWKMVSQKMAENGIKNKDQLQCRTHG